MNTEYRRYTSNREHEKVIASWSSKRCKLCGRFIKIMQEYCPQCLAKKEGRHIEPFLRRREQHRKYNRERMRVIRNA